MNVQRTTCLLPNRLLRSGTAGEPGGCESDVNLGQPLRPMPQLATVHIYIDAVVFLTISGAIASQDNRCSAMADGVEVVTISARARLSVDIRMFILYPLVRLCQVFVDQQMTEIWYNMVYLCIMYVHTVLLLCTE